MQCVVDNVNHNLRNLDGKNTFHGMGIIATATPGTSQVRQVPRMKVSGRDIAAAGKIEIRPPSQPRMANLEIVCNNIPTSRVEDTTATVLMGDDTHLLVLLSYHTKVDGNDLYIRPEPKGNARDSRV